MNKNYSMIIALAVVLSLIPLSVCAKQATEEIIVLRTHAHVPGSNGLAIRYRWWCERVTEKSKGKVQFEHYYAQSLAKSKDQWKALGAGLFDLGNCHPFYIPSNVPMLMITEQPGAITYDSTVVGKAYADLVALPAVQKELKNMNVHFFYAVNPGGSRWLGTVDKPVKSVADLKGLKIRESGGFAKLYGKLGASPVSMPVPDVYDALAKGTLDGFSGPISAFTAYGFSEVCKYYNRISVGPGEGIWLMNLDRWNEMPPEIQKIRCWRNYC